jgi:hypothetical protein
MNEKLPLIPKWPKLMTLHSHLSVECSTLTPSVYSQLNSC